MSFVRYILLCLFLPLSINCLADPFYPSHNTDERDKTDEASLQAVEKAQHSAKNREKLTACLPANLNRLAIGTPFSQLKLIGIVEINRQFRALFINEKQQIIDLRIDDLLDTDFIQITEINLKSVRYIDWAKSPHCNEPVMMTLKL